jgi:hypothetical protein
MEDSPHILSFLGHGAVDESGAELGRIEGFYLDESDAPQWVAVALSTGGAECVVPLTGAQPAGDELQVGFASELVLNAPVVDLSDSQIWPGSVFQLFGGGAMPAGFPKRWP